MLTDAEAVNTLPGAGAAGDFAELGIVAPAGAVGEF